MNQKKKLFNFLSLYYQKKKGIMNENEYNYRIKCILNSSIFFSKTKPDSSTIFDKYIEIYWSTYFLVNDIVSTVTQEEKIKYIPNFIEFRKKYIQFAKMEYLHDKIKVVETKCEEEFSLTIYKKEFLFYKSELDMILNDITRQGYSFTNYEEQRVATMKTILHECEDRINQTVKDKKLLFLSIFYRNNLDIHDIILYVKNFID